jgi:hypothetical protein
MLDNNALNDLSELEVEEFTCQEAERRVELLKQIQGRLQVNVQDLERREADSKKALEKKLSNDAALHQEALAALNAKYKEDMEAAETHHQKENDAKGAKCLVPIHVHQFNSI